MKCLLINPCYPISETPSPPLGLAYLAAVLERAACPVQVLDFVVFPYSKSHLSKILNEFHPELVGVTSVTMNFREAIRAIRDVKQLAPHVVTVMGGPHVTFCSRETLEQCPELDIVVLGEGEDTLVRLATSDPQEWPRIPGIVYRLPDGIHLNPASPQPIDVNRLPLPARHLLPLGRYRALRMPVTMTTSRGCPFRCIFCVGRRMVGSVVRYRHPESVADELEILSGMGFHQVNIADDLFTANKYHCLAICDEILRRNIRVPWTSFARVDTVSPEILERMKSAGCTAVSFGIESGNSDILKTIQKGITKNQVRQAVRWCTQAGILPHGSFILGLPGETPETIQETLEFGKELGELGLSYGFHLLAPFPGTRLREKSEAYGITILSSDWSDYHANRAIVQTPWVSREMMDRIVMDWENDFDAQLGRIAERIQSGEASESEAALLVNLERTVLLHELMMSRLVETRGIMSTMEEEEERLADIWAQILLPECRNTNLEKLADTIRYALGKGFLRYVRENGSITWRWAD